LVARESLSVQLTGAGLSWCYAHNRLAHCAPSGNRAARKPDLPNERMCGATVAAQALAMRTDPDFENAISRPDIKLLDYERGHSRLSRA